MKRMQFRHRDYCRFSLAMLVGAGLRLAGGDDARAGEDWRLVKGIENFSSVVASQSVEAASISDAGSAGAGGAERLAWGQARLEDLDRMRQTADGDILARTEDVFAFRDWCIEAPGRGNLLLAIAAEETAATLLLRALADDQTCGDEVRQRFARCLPNGLSPDYWLETLAMEGIVVDWGDALKATDPKYVRWGTVLDKTFDMLGGWDSLPGRNDTWNGCTDAFAPAQLAFRSISLVRREIALEVCLEMLAGAGGIPEERTAFIAAAEKYAEATLDQRNRATGRITPHEVWRHWTAAHADLKKDSTDLREDSGARETDNAGDSKSALTEP